MARMPSAPIFWAWRGERERVLDRERADVHGDRHAAGDDLHGGFGEQLALRDGEVERLALVVRPGDRGRAGADVEVEHLLEGRQVEAEIVLERRDRALHHAAEFVLHWRSSVIPELCGFAAPCAAGNLPSPPRSVKRPRLRLRQGAPVAGASSAHLQKARRRKPRARKGRHCHAASGRARCFGVCDRCADRGWPARRR